MGLRRTPPRAARAAGPLRRPAYIDAFRTGLPTQRWRRKKIPTPPSLAGHATMFLGAAVVRLFSFFHVGSSRGTRAPLRCSCANASELQIPLFVGNMDGGGVNTSVVPAGCLLPAQVRSPTRGRGSKPRCRSAALSLCPIDFARRPQRRRDAPSARRDCWGFARSRAGTPLLAAPGGAPGAHRGSTCR